MATTLPADATKSNSDAATDDPKQAILTDLAGAVDMENALKAALGAGAQLNLGDGLEQVAQTDPTPNDLRVRLQAASGLVRAAAGIALDIAALQKQSYTAIDDTGAADAMVLTFAPAISGYTKYQAFMAKVVATNTTATTVNVNGEGAKSFKKWKDGAKVALEAGDLVVGMIADMVYDDTDFILLNPTVSAGLPASDFTSSEQTVSTNTQLDVAHGIGAVPTLVRVVLRCTTSNLGYSVNDEVFATNIQHGSGNDRGWTLSANATNVTISTGSPIRIFQKGGSSVSSITVGSWRWAIKAWK